MHEEALTLGKHVLSKMPAELEQKHTNAQVYYAILDMFIKCGDFEMAEALFNRSNRNVISYGSMMKMYNLTNRPEKTLTLYARMKREKIEANYVIFIVLLNACAQLSDLSLRETIRSQIPPNLSNNLKIRTSLVDMWASADVISRNSLTITTFSRVKQAQ
jgi:pentatricopeptide repeat protein